MPIKKTKPANAKTMADKSKKITRSSVKQGAVVGKAKKTSVSKKIFGFNELKARP